MFWEPFARNIDVDNSTPGWANKLACSTFRDLRNSDCIFAKVNVSPPDTGVMDEIGVSIALGKTTFLFRDDFRKCTDSDESPPNLMVFTGIPLILCIDYYYCSLDEIENKNKSIDNCLGN